MFKVTFTTTETAILSPAKYNSRTERNGFGSFVTGQYQLARQIKASLDGICLDNPQHNIDTDIVAQIRTRRGNATISLDDLDNVADQLRYIQEEVTAPRYQHGKRILAAE